MIKTDLRLFGFPVHFDPRMDRNVIELHNPNGQVIRIVIEPEKQQPEAGPPSARGGE